MELISSPEVVEELVTDLDVFTTIGPQSVTLRADDTVNYDSVIRGEPAFVVTTKTPDESTTIFVKHIVGYKIRRRIMRRPTKQPSPGPEV